MRKIKRLTTLFLFFIAAPQQSPAKWFQEGRLATRFNNSLPTGACQYRDILTRRYLWYRTAAASKNQDKKCFWACRLQVHGRREPKSRFVSRALLPNNNDIALGDKHRRLLTSLDNVNYCGLLLLRINCLNNQCIHRLKFRGDDFH